MQLLIMGPPGAGKGTQAKLIAARHNIPAISTGDIFRSLQTQDTSLAQQVRQIMAVGGYISDDITDQIVAQRLAAEDCRAGFMLDGYPRTPGQVAALDRLLSSRSQPIEAVISLTVPRQILLTRLVGRGQAEHRADDTSEVIATRLDIYEQTTAPLLELYRMRGLLVEVDGSDVVDEVTRRILAVLEDVAGAGAQSLTDSVRQGSSA
jgi:adenylate kinase